MGAPTEGGGGGYGSRDGGGGGGYGSRDGGGGGGYGGRGGRGDRPPPDTSVRGRLRARARKKARKSKKKGGFIRRKVCRYCADSTIAIDYKDPKSLRLFVTEIGKMIPRRISGNCAKHQRKLAVAIKRARHIALLPYAGQGQ
jgi:small subunit ribosomal protein S18